MFKTGDYYYWPNYEIGKIIQADDNNFTWLRMIRHPGYTSDNPATGTTGQDNHFSQNLILLKPRRVIKDIFNKWWPI